MLTWRRNIPVQQVDGSLDTCDVLENSEYPLAETLTVEQKDYIFSHYKLYMFGMPYGLNPESERLFLFPFGYGPCMLCDTAGCEDCNHKGYEEGEDDEEGYCDARW